MSKRALLLALPLLPVLVSLALLHWALGLDWGLLTRLGPGVQLALLALVLLELFNGSLLVRVLTMTGGHALRLRDACLVHCCSLGLNYLAPAKAGALLKPYLLHKSAAVPYALGTAVLMMEIVLISGIPALAAVPALLFLVPEAATPGSPLAGLLVLALVLVAGMALVWARAGNNNAAQALSQNPGESRRARLQHLVRDLCTAVRCIGLRSLPVGLLLVAAGLATQTARLWLILACYTTPPDLLSLLAVTVAALSVGRATPLPMGLGTQDLSYGLLLAVLGIPGEVILLTIAWQRLFSNGVPVLAGLVAAGALGFRQLPRVMPP